MKARNPLTTRLADIFPKKRLFDSHCHLTDMPGYPKHHLDEAMISGVEAVAAVATDLKSSAENLKLQEKFPSIVLAGAGIHPELLVPGSDLFNPALDELKLEEQLNALKKLLTSGNYKLLGECGLDYYWLFINKSLTKREIDRSQALQEYLLIGQLKLARLLGLAVSLHSRASEAEALKLIKMFNGKLEVIFHSFTGTYEQGAEILEAGGKLGINGIITYKSAEALRQTLKKLVGNHDIKEPEDLYQLGFYLETDSPLLFPANSPVREKYNSPKQIPFIWQFIYNFLNH